MRRKHVVLVVELERACLRRRSRSGILGAGDWHCVTWDWLDSWGHLVNRAPGRPRKLPVQRGDSGIPTSGTNLNAQDDVI
jgi:hypothetical protein